MAELTASPPPGPPSAGDRAEEEQAVKKLFLRGSAWALGNYVIAYALRLGCNLVLWRLLFPAAFGLMAIVNVFIQGLAMFSDIGIGQGVVQHARGEEPDFLNTVWTLQVLRGLFLCAIACAGAAPMAHFYKQPDLTRLILIVAMSVGISAFNSTNFYTASRRMALGRLTVIDLVSQVVSVVAMIVWSYITRSVWALAWGSVISTALRLYLGHTFLPGIRNRFRWDRETVRAMSHFGRWVFLSTLLNFMSSSSDRLIFGKVITISELGVYSIATVWATLPTYVVSHLVNSVLFPLLSRVHGAGVALSESFIKLRRPIVWASAWLAACLFAGGPTLIHFLYDKRAADAGIIVQLLALGSWFSTLENVNSAGLLALGRPKGMAPGHAAKLVAMVVLMFVAGKLFGFFAAVLALSVSELARYAVSVRVCWLAKLRPLRQDLALTAGIGATAICGLLTRRAYRGLHLGLASVHLDAFLEGTAIFLVLTSLWLAAFLRVRRREALA